MHTIVYNDCNFCLKKLSVQQWKSGGGIHLKKICVHWGCLLFLSDYKITSQ